MSNTTDTATGGDFSFTSSTQIPTTSSFDNGGFTTSDTFTSPSSTYEPTTSSPSPTPTTTAGPSTSSTPFEPTSSTPPTTSATSPTTSDTTSATPPVVTSEITQSDSSQNPITITITSTSPSATPTQASTTGKSSSSSHASTAAASTSGGTSLPTAGAVTQHHGLTTGGKVAVAVVVPVVAVALIVLALLFFWRKRKQRKDAADMRRKEVEEYGFNPNNDPTLPPVGGMDHGDGMAPYEMREDDSGYRGWGATPNNGRKLSTNLSSAGGAAGVARSDSGSQPGGYQNHANGHSPTQGTTGTNSEAHSGDPLIHGSPHEAEAVGALGAAPGAAFNSANNKQGVHRGPSNASSSYSAAGRSDASGDAPIPAGAHSPKYYTSEGTFPDDPAYYSAAGVGGPYGDASYGGGATSGQGQPVIRDVKARRNTRIENPSIFPQAGNSGISQNF